MSSSLRPSASGLLPTVVLVLWLLFGAAFNTEAQSGGLAGPTDTTALRISGEHYNRVFKSFAPCLYIGLGYMHTDFSGLSNELQQGNYPGITNHYFAVSGGYHIRLNRFMFGMQIQSYSAEAESNSRTTAVANTGFGTFIGYGYLSANNSFYVYPMAGYALAVTDINLVDNAASPAGVAALLGNTSANKAFRYQQVSLLLGVGAEYYPFDATVLKRGLIGVRVGYLSPLGAGSYYLRNPKQTINGPRIDTSGAYAHLMVGFAL